MKMLYKTKGRSKTKAAKNISVTSDGELHSYAPIGFEKSSEPDLILYIYDEIGPEVDYVELVHALRYAPEGQKITIHINSPGGNLNSCLSIVNAIGASDAEITTVVDGEAASAAAMIWLSGHYKVIASPHTVVMLHGASCGFKQSKTSDIVTSSLSTNTIVESLLDDLATGFLTEDERDDIRKGVDIYITGSEIIERLNINIEDTEETQ
jgi:ATP-dependent Clp protease protease subunit